LTQYKIRPIIFTVSHMNMLIESVNGYMGLGLTALLKLLINMRTFNESSFGKDFAILVFWIKTTDKDLCSIRSYIANYFGAEIITMNIR
jgi:hypothetical protein